MSQAIESRSLVYPMSAWSLQTSQQTTKRSKTSVPTSGYTLRCPYQGAARFALTHLITERGDTQQWVSPLIVYCASVVLSCVHRLSSYVDALSVIAYSDDVATSGVVA